MKLDRISGLHQERCEISSLSLSPDEKQLAFVTQKANGTGNWVSRLYLKRAGEKSPEEIARFAKIFSVSWSPAGSKLAVLAERPVESDGDAEGTQVWVLRPDGDVKHVTQHGNDVKAFDWGPDGNRLVLDAYEEDSKDGRFTDVFTTEDRYYLQSLNNVTTERNYLYTYDLTAESKTKLELAHGSGRMNVLTGLQPDWSPDSDRIAFISNRTDDPMGSNVMDVYVIDLTTGGLTKVTDTNRFVTEVKWSPRGDALAYIGRDPVNTYVRSDLYLTDVDGRSHRLLSDEADRWVRNCAWASERTVLASVSDEGRERLVTFELEGEYDRVALDWLAEHITITDFDVSGGTTIAAGSTPDNRAEILEAGTNSLLDDPQASDREMTQTRISDGFPEVGVDKIRLSHADGSAVESYVFTPPDSSKRREPRPAVFSLHSAGSYASPKFDFERLCWLHEGYTVVEVNYSGSVSYGKAFAESGWRNLKTRGVNDVVTVAETLIDRERIDPDRLFTYGFSKGALLAGYLLTQTDLFRAACVSRGVYDLRSLYGFTVHDDLHELAFGLPWENAETYMDASVLPEIDRIDSPVLVVASEHDMFSPPSQSKRLHSCLRERGVPSRLVYYRKQGHDFTKPEYELHHAAEILRWFERHDA